MRSKLLYLFLYHKFHCKILHFAKTKSSHFENTRVRSTSYAVSLKVLLALSFPMIQSSGGKHLQQRPGSPKPLHSADNSHFSMRGTLLDVVFLCSLDVEIWSSWASNSFQCGRKIHFYKLEEFRRC